MCFNKKGCFYEAVTLTKCFITALTSVFNLLKFSSEAKAVTFSKNKAKWKLEDNACLNDNDKVFFFLSILRG